MAARARCVRAMGAYLAMAALSTFPGTVPRVVLGKQLRPLHGRSGTRWRARPRALRQGARLVRAAGVAARRMDALALPRDQRPTAPAARRIRRDVRRAERRILSTHALRAAASRAAHPAGRRGAGNRAALAHPIVGIARHRDGRRAWSRAVGGMDRIHGRLASSVARGAGARLRARWAVVWDSCSARARRALDLRAPAATEAAGALARRRDAGLGIGDDAMAAVARLREELSRRSRRDAGGARAEAGLRRHAQSHRAAEGDVPLPRRHPRAIGARLPLAPDAHRDLAGTAAS